MHNTLPTPFLLIELLMLTTSKVDLPPERGPENHEVIVRYL